MMKNSIKLILLTILIFIFFSLEKEVQALRQEKILGETTFMNYESNQRGICNDNLGYIHVVWNNGTLIKYARSTDNGQTWTVNNSFYGATSTKTSTKGSPHISCDGNNITVSYSDEAADDTIIAISTDNGQTWIWKNPVTSIVKSWVQVERRGQRIYVVYQKEEYDTQEKKFYYSIDFLNSSDGGNTWGNVVNIISSVMTFSITPSLAVDGNGGNNDKIYVVAEKISYLTNDIVFVNSTNSGASWGSETKIMNTSCNSPSITFNSSNLYVVAYNTTNYTIHFTSSTNSGITWAAPIRLDTIGNTVNITRYPSVTINNLGYPMVFWEQNGTNLNYDIVYREYNGASWGNIIYLTNNTLSNVFVNTKYNYYGSPIELFYMNGTGSIKNITYVRIQPSLSATLNQPDPNIYTESNNYRVNRYNKFNVNATVTCQDYDCGVVNGNARHNSSSGNPDTDISMTEGAAPFFILTETSHAISNTTSGTTVYDPQNASDNNFNDTITSAFISALSEYGTPHTDTQSITYQWDFNETYRNATLFYTWRVITSGASGCTGQANVYLYDWDTSSFDLKVNLENTDQSGTFNLTVDNEYINSTGGIKVKFEAKVGCIPSQSGETKIYLNDTYISTKAENGLTCLSLSKDQSCQLNWNVNATGNINTYWKIDVNFTSSNSLVSSNTTNVAYVRIPYAAPILTVTLSTPNPSTCIASSPCKWIQNNTYPVQANVSCLDGPCGDVYGAVRYNSSSGNPDTDVSMTEGSTPFHVVELGKTITVVDANGDLGQHSSIALDSNGNAHISYQNYTGADLRYCNNTLGTWTCTDVDTDGITGYYSSIAIDSNNKAHIAYYGTPGAIRYCNNTLGTWTCTSVNAVVGSSDISIAIDSNNKVHITYYNATTEGLGYCNNTLGTWTCTDLETGGSVGRYSSIAIDSNNKVHISHYNLTGGDLRYCNNTLGTWTCTNVETGGNVGYYSSIAIDSNNKAHISHQNVTGFDLRYCNNTLGTWTCTNIETGGIVGEYSSIAIDSNNKPHIYHSNTTDNSLRYCYINNLNFWKCYEIGNAGGLPRNSGRAIAIKKGRLSTSISFSQYAHISYYNATTKDLTYAKISHNLLSCGYLNDGNICNLNWTVNATGSLNTYWKIDVNFTSSMNVTEHTQDAIIKIVWPHLVVTLESPNPELSFNDLIQNQNYSVTAKVECIDGPCGYVNGTLRYNLSANLPNTPISIAPTTPFYIVDFSNPLDCGYVDDGSYCRLTWTLNVTGEENSIWKIDVNFTTNSTLITPQDTSDATIRIVIPTIIIHGSALYYYTGEKVNGDIIFIPLENSYTFTSSIHDGRWSLYVHTDLSNLSYITLIAKDNEKIGYNEIKIANPTVPTPRCSAQTIQLSGYSIDLNTGNPISSGTIKAAVLETDYITSSAFSGSWAITMNPCLVKGKIYTIQITVADSSGQKKGEYFQKYPAS